MRGNSFARLALLVLALASACQPARLGPLTPQPLASPAGSWTLNLTQSGGLVGVQLGLEVSSAGQLTATDKRSGRTVTRTLSPETIAELRSLISEASLSGAAGKPSQCADCFLYDLTITSDSGTFQLQADDVTLTDPGAKALVGRLRALRDSALAAQP